MLSNIPCAFKLFLSKCGIKDRLFFEIFWESSERNIAMEGRNILFSRTIHTAVVVL